MKLLSINNKNVWKNLVSVSVILADPVSEYEMTLTVFYLSKFADFIY